MLGLTSLVFLFYTAIRILDVAVYKKHSAEDLMTIPTPGNASNLIRQAERNLANLFEFPVFFYIVCIIIYVTGKVDDYFILLSYWFVGFRFIHSIYHIFFNGFVSVLPLRAMFFVPSWAILVWMWVRLISSF
tara:strand:+ start:45 stop:440 length:396 start_codon:yes stop_codon:yes gene_type:complete